MQQQTVGAFLDDLADRSPAPGGGAVAALHVAQAAALVCMVGRYSDGPKYAEHAEAIQASVRAADRLRRDALALAEQDATAFSEVSAAYAAPKGTEAEKEARRAAIQKALAGAARPPAAVVAAAREAVSLAAGLAPIANRNLISDLAAAAEAARAGAATARVNIVVNVAMIRDPDVRSEFSAIADGVDAILAAADQVTRDVLREIAR